MKFEKNRIMELRGNEGLSQVEFARRLGTSKQKVCNWEHGDSKPQVDSLVNICNTFGVDIGYFFV